MILYATRDLNEKETEEYSRRYNLHKSSLTTQEHLLEELAKEYETDLNILGILGFKEQLKPDAYDLIQTAARCSIHTWILSGDQEAQTLSCANALNISDQKLKILKISQ